MSCKKVFVFLVAAVCVSFSATASAEDVKSPAVPEAAHSSSGESFENCMNDVGCPVKDRIALMRGMHGKMIEALSEADKECVRSAYEYCAGPTASEMQMIHKMHTDMQSRVNEMKAQNLMAHNAVEVKPQAGDKDESPWSAFKNWFPPKFK